MANISLPLHQLCDVDHVVVVVCDGEKDGDAEVLEGELGPGRRRAGGYQVLIRVDRTHLNQGLEVVMFCTEFCCKVLQIMFWEVTRTSGRFCRPS